MLLDSQSLEVAVEETITTWLFDPTVGEIVATLFAIILVAAAVRLAHAWLAGRVRDQTTRCRARKFVTVGTRS